MIQLSACVIVKNEEKNIKRWLESIGKIANEMIVVDTGSDDQTVAIAQNLGAKVYFYHWKNDFAAAKNFALSKASGNWILFLDADEYFSEQTIYQVPALIKRIHANKNIDAVCNFLFDIDPDEGNRYIGKSKTIRIFRRNQQLQYAGMIHETLVRQGGVLRLLEAGNEILIYHTGYAKSIINAKLRRNLDLLQKEIAETGEQRRHYSYLLDCYYGLGEYEKAIVYAKRCVKAKVEPFGQESMIYRRWIDSLVYAQAKDEEVLAVVDQAIQKYPNLPEFFWNKGKILFDQRKYREAEIFLQESLGLYEKGDFKGESGSFEVKLTFCYYLLGEIFCKKNDLEQALLYYVKALETDEYNKLALGSLYENIRFYDAVDVIEILQHVYEIKDEEKEKILQEILQRYPLDPVYLYYTKKYHWQMSQDGMGIIAGLIMADKKEAALETAKENSKEACEWMLLSLLLSETNEIPGSADLILPSVYKKIFAVYKGQEKKQSLSEEEEKIYQSVWIKGRAIYPHFPLAESVALSKIQNLLTKILDDEVKAENQLILRLEEYQWGINELFYFVYGLYEKDWVKTTIDLAVYLCNHGYPENGIELLETALDKVGENGDILYALVFLLHAYEQDHQILEIIEKHDDIDEKLKVLLEDIFLSIQE